MLKMPINPSAMQSQTLNLLTHKPGTPANALQNSTPLTQLRSLVGQTLPIAITQVSGNQAQFNLNGQNYQAFTQLALKAGDNLQVRVEQHQGQIRLTLQQPVGLQETLKGHYRMLLPQQANIQQTLQFLAQPQLLQQLPPAVQAQIHSLLDKALRPNASLSGHHVKAAMVNSGQFLENKLRQGTHKNSLAQDTKAQLFKLQNQLSQSSGTPSLTQALSLVKQAISKITLNQLHQYETPSLTLAELPIQDDDKVDSVRIEIRRQPRGDWEIILALSFEQEADVFCKLCWVKDDYFNVFFYTENPALAQHLDEKLTLLRDMFAQAQLPLKNLTLTAVKPSFSQNAQHIGLIDIKI